MTDLTIIILAAGEGTRMRSATPKLLHQVAGLPIIGHVLNAATNTGAANIGVVTSPKSNSLKETILQLAPKAQLFEQVEQKGTAHAAKMAKPLWEKADGYVLVTYGDHPLLRAQNFEIIIEKLNKGFDVAILGFEPIDATGYGRFITNGEKLLNIVEHKDATNEQKEIGLCNACILGFKAEIFRETITKVENNNAQNEYYLGDLVPLANKAGYQVTYAIAPSDDVIGVNDRQQLAQAEQIYQNRLRQKFMRAGVTLKDPSSTYFSYDSEIENDVIIEPNVIIGNEVTIRAGAIIKGFSHIEGATISENAIIGPFARLRPGAELGKGAKAGNFVEVKKAQVGAGAKLNHLSYIGDAMVGEGANIGAGTITCNYDGVNKAITNIGKGAFIGSNSSLIAPVKIGDNAYIASGSVIVKDVPIDALAIARSKQENKEAYAPKIKARAKAIKRKKQKGSK